ncbi:MAG: glycosyltransferase family 2 protein [Tannerella sp.]|jgi:GT2 family glycosyltransferase|nr:glycosyltransferase family 2 protein [Tannerella sp.]
MKNDAPRILAIIITFNGEKWIVNCMNSVLSSAQKLSVLVVDNNSADNTVSIIKRNYPEVILIENRGNIGFGQANNAGFDYALSHQFDFVLLLNQDAAITPSTVDCLLHGYEKNQEYGLISPLHFQGNGTLPDNKFYKYITNGCRSYITDLIAKREIRQIYSSGFINAAIWFLSAECIKKVGGFDPVFFHAGEDVDYYARVLYHGFKAGLCPSAIAFHYRENRKETNSRNRHFYYQYLQAVNWLKNPNYNRKARVLIYHYVINAFRYLFFLDTFSFGKNISILVKIFRSMGVIKKNKRICMNSVTPPFLKVYT